MVQALVHKSCPVIKHYATQDKYEQQQLIGMRTRACQYYMYTVER